MPSGHASESGVDPDEVIALIEGYLNQLATATHERLGTVGGVAVTMADRNGRPVTAGASTELAVRVDELQYRIGYGPCLHALAGRGGGYFPDLAADGRWGSYGPRAAALGARCCLSIPVTVEDAVLAVFKVYAETVDGLDEGQRAIGHDAAREAAGSLGLARLLASTSEDLADRVSAMDSRRTIDLAIGRLMERAKCTPDMAFDLLRRQAQNHNRKLRDVAAEVVGAPVSAPFRSRASGPST